MFKKCSSNYYHCLPVSDSCFEFTPRGPGRAKGVRSGLYLIVVIVRGLITSINCTTYFFLSTFGIYKL